MVVPCLQFGRKAGEPFGHRGFQLAREDTAHLEAADAFRDRATRLSTCHHDLLLTHLGGRIRRRPAVRPGVLQPAWTKLGWCVISHWTGGGATICRSISSSPKPVIRCSSPLRAPRSGNSARSIVVPRPTVTSQS